MTAPNVAKVKLSPTPNTPSVVDRQQLYDKLLASTQELLDIIYNDKKGFVNAGKNIHPIEDILISSYDQIITFPQAARLASMLIGIVLPLSEDEDVSLYERLKEYLTLEKQGKVELREIIMVNKVDYLKLPMSKLSTYNARTDYSIYLQLKPSNKSD
jgi:hypothetical protein